MRRNHWMKRVVSSIATSGIAVCIAAGIAIGISACGIGDGLSASTKDLTKQYLQENQKEDNGQATSQNAGQQTVSEEFYRAYIDFSLNLLKQSLDVQSESPNTMVSPLSVMIAMEMTRNGAVKPFPRWKLHYIRTLQRNRG